MTDYNTDEKCLPMSNTHTPGLSSRRRRPRPLPLHLLRVVLAPPRDLHVRSPHAHRPIIRTRRQRAVCPVHRAHLARLPALERDAARPRSALTCPRTPWRRSGRRRVEQIRAPTARAPAREPATAWGRCEADIERVRRRCLRARVGLSRVREGEGGKRGRGVRVYARVGAEREEQARGGPAARGEGRDAPLAARAVVRRRVRRRGGDWVRACRFGGLTGGGGEADVPEF